MLTNEQMHGTTKRFSAAVGSCPRAYGLQTPSARISINLDWRCGP